MTTQTLPRRSGLGQCSATPASILLVDDLPANLLVLEAVLEQPNLRIVRAGSGEEALHRLLEEDFALILMDVQMPGMDGFETARLIHGNARTRHVPIIFVTAISKDERYVFKGYGCGAVDYLFKPLDPDIVRSKVRVFLDLHQQREELRLKSEQLHAANASLEEALRQMKADLAAAARIQHHLLPSRGPDSPHTHFAWFFQPCEELAGDIFNVFKLGNGHIGLYLLDVSGHGVQASLLSSALSHLLAGGATQGSPLWDQESHASPGAVLAGLNRRFPMDQDLGQYFTILYGVLEEETGRFCFSSAGHPPPLVCRREPAACEVFPNPGPPIGWMTEDAKFPEQCIQLKPGDRVLLYSDGVVEASGSSSAEFGLIRMQERLLSRPSLSLENTVQHLANAVTEWSGGELKDDVSILALEYR